MVSLSQLWLPIVLSAVLVFMASSILHMVLKYHNADYKKFANEDEVRAAISKQRPEPGEYMIPYCIGPEEMKKPEMMQKFTDGPVGMLLLRRPGAVSMGPLLAQWFVYLLVVSFFTAYVACHTIAPGTAYLPVFRVVGTVAFMAYAGSHAQMAIWWGEPWSVAIKDIVDGLIYGLVTAGTFGWLWPR